MKGLADRIARIPFQWKLTIASAVLLSMLFVVNNVTQYALVESWMIKQEEAQMERDMREILNLLIAREAGVQPENYAYIRTEFEKRNVRSGMIRLLNYAGEPIVVAANNMESAWESGQQLSHTGKSGVERRGSMLVMQSPITIFQFHGTVEMVRSMEEVDRLVANFNKFMVVCGAAAVLLSLVGGRMMALMLIRPLRGMYETMRKVKQNGLQERMPQSGARDEITALKTMFNDMMDEVERAFQGQKQFVEDASHELRTPIAIMEGHLKLLSRWGKHDPSVLDRSLNSSLEELERLKKLVEQLLVLSRAEKRNSARSEPASCSAPSEVIAAAVAKMETLHPSFTFVQRLDALKGLALTIGELQLAQVVHILMDNAVKYSGDSRTVEIAAAVNDHSAELSVIDYGIGIAAEELPHVWDRFYRADKARNSESGGYGLGLSIAKSLVEDCGGATWLHSQSGSGTTATVRLSISEKAARL
ncbi:ATP-binding protein [Paenibacillus sp. GCM10027627]|uniref:ATP-binding protein n=1 Tax=unclassified Paenibacillus TaxID=185978 RepID=UPI00362C51E1